MSRPRRLLLQQGLALAALATGTARADWAPTQPVRIILPIGPGGASDLMFRTLQNSVGAALGQPLVIDYKPGGGTVIGTELAARAAPDGLTLCLAANSTLINQGLHAALPYNVFRDFQPIARLGIVPHVLVCHPAVASDLRGLIRFARSKPGGASFASYGQGTSNHLGFEHLRLLADFPATHVPYRGGPPAYADLMAGRVDCMFMNLPGAFQPVAAGTLRALGVTAATRIARLDAPTMAEIGQPDVLSNTWTGVVAPGPLPPAIAARLEAVFLAAVGEPANRARLEDAGFTILAEDAARFSAAMQADFRTYQAVIARAGVTLG
jgi:tripartite-type tricarboxylate transporter receptor subunit TctC